MHGTIAGKAHLRQEVVISGVSNALFNGVIAWFLLRHGPALRWSGDHSFAADMIATGLLLPLIVALIVIPLQRSKLRKGELQPINLGSSSMMQSIANRFPTNAFGSALLFGLFGMAIIAPLTLLGFYVLGIDETGPGPYAIFKGIWAGIVAGVLVIPMVLIALRELPSTPTTAR